MSGLVACGAVYFQQLDRGSRRASAYLTTRASVGPGYVTTIAYDSPGYVTTGILSLSTLLLIVMYSHVDLTFVTLKDTE